MQVTLYLRRSEMGSQCSFSRRGVELVAGCQENESCSKVFNFLERLDYRIRCTHEEIVALRHTVHSCDGDEDELLTEVD